MLTNPNTLGLFEEEIAEIAAAVHEVGGLLYYDGANLNAILGVVRPGDMGFDIVHLNLHKTFATPHGGGGPGQARWRSPSDWPTSCPGPRRRRRGDGSVFVDDARRSIGRVHSWHGNALVLARALAYIRVHGGDGLRRVAERAVLNANWLRHRLSRHLRRPSTGRACTRCVLTATRAQERVGVRALDVGQAAAGGGLPLADRLLPARRRRGAHDRADRDREPTDARRPRRGVRAHRRGGAGRTPSDGRAAPIRRPFDVSTRRVRRARWSRPSTLARS